MRDVATSSVLTLRNFGFFLWDKNLVKVTPTWGTKIHYTRFVRTPIN